jgi:hypothetical protein
MHATKDNQREKERSSSSRVGSALNVMLWLPMPWRETSLFGVGDWSSVQTASRLEDPLLTPNEQQPVNAVS